MKTKSLMILGMVLSATPISAELVCQGQAILQTDQKTHVFEIEIAANPVSRSMGLMHRKSMPDDFGMLFLFPNEAPRYFWMKDTYISLDMIFYNTNGKPVGLQKETTPLDETPLPGGDAIAVFEINAGLVDMQGLDGASLRYEIPQVANCPDMVLAHPLRQGN